MWLESRVVDGEVGLTVDSSLFLFVCLFGFVLFGLQPFLVVSK